MEYDILLTKLPDHRYTAQPLQMPDILVTGTNEAEALTLVHKAIVGRHAQSRIVRIEIPMPGEQSNDPWFRFADMWGDEATWQQFEDDIQRFRFAEELRTSADL